MIKKMGITELIFELQEHKAKIRGDLRGYVVAVVTYYVTKEKIKTC